jgi:hypothetical protein
VQIEATLRDTEQGFFMGVTLGYVSRETLPHQAHADILAEAKRVTAGRRWWCEGINFVEAHEPLSGATRLLLLGYSTKNGGYVEVEPPEDMFMAARDARFVLEQLARWSLDHQVSWQVAIEGADPVPVEKGQIDPTLLQMIDALHTIAGNEGLPTAEGEALAKKLDEKYASRWE